MVSIQVSTLSRRRSAFSLIELLVVIAILVVLIALTVAVATGINTSSRSRAAADSIRVLDQSVEAWVTSTGSAVPSAFDDLQIVDGTRVDGVDWPSPWPSLGLFAAAIGSETSAIEVINAIDTTWRSSVRETNLDADLDLLRVVDPWGNPIRFVHPANDGGWGDYFNGSGVSTNRPNLVLTTSSGDQEFRRSWRPGTQGPGDADEGICPGGGTRPYFYSAGPDGDPGTTKDNVYSERPQFPNETLPSRVRGE